jgi:hypothetical protein
MSFNDYAEAGFTGELLPILPPDAPINPGSPARENLERSRGKVPGKKSSGGWFGFGGWSQYHSGPEDYALWDNWNAGIGLQGRKYPAVDIDVDNEGVACAIKELALFVLGPAAVRIGRGSRCILIFSGEGFTKRRLAFSLPGRDENSAAEFLPGPEVLRPTGRDFSGVGAGRGEDEAPATPASSAHAIELLGDGQQYVIEGIHPKTLKPYRWEDGVSPLLGGASGVTVVTMDEVNAFFDAAEQMLVERFDATILSSSAASIAKGSGATLQAGLLAPSLEAVEHALAAIENDLEYDEWIQVMAATKGATDGQGFDIFADWSSQGGKDDPDVTEQKWESLRSPYQLGWGWLSRMAGSKSGGAFNGATEEFDEVASTLPDEPAALTAGMFNRYVFVERIEAVVDLTDLTILNKLQFNARNWHVGNPNDNRKSAWAQFMEQGDQRRSVRSVTYRPGVGRFYTEAEGECVNIWKAPPPIAPGVVSDSDIAPWLDHMAYLIDRPAERAILFDWMAYLIQHQDQKPNWGVLVGGAHGIGKSTMLAPVREALGYINCREIGPVDLASGYTGWLAETKLFVVEEMHTFERKETMQRLKGFLADPPHTLQINPKFGKQFEIPNLCAGVFFTNHDNALAIERGERRFFVLWSDAQPREPAYYTKLMAWYKAGGAAKAARWLLNRDVTAFDAKAPAPTTAAGEAMRQSTRSLLDEWIEDGIEHGEGVFSTNLVAVEEVRRMIPDEVAGRQAPTGARISSALRRAGARPLGQVYLSGVVNMAFDISRTSLVSVRRHEMFAGLDRTELCKVFAAEKARVTKIEEGKNGNEFSAAV